MDGESKPTDSQQESNQPLVNPLELLTSLHGKNGVMPNMEEVKKHLWILMVNLLLHQTC
jgi:hypothetical protein